METCWHLFLGVFFFSVFGIICNLGPFSLFCRRICVLNSKKTVLEWCRGFVEQRKIRNEGSYFFLRQVVGEK